MGGQPDPSGTILAGRYRVLDRVAAGGMGTIYTGEHTLLGHRVAIKLLRAEAGLDPKKAERFRREARAAAQIDHENVVQCIDIGVTDDGVLFYVMEWLRGADLQSELKKLRRIPWPRARTIVLQVCRALAAAHSRGIIHRDLKPSNLFLIRRGDTTDFVKVVDFGVAKRLVGETASGALTSVGELIGTIAYMAPEQAAGEEVDARTDIYTTGVILYQMLTGRVPYPSKKAREVVTALLTSSPPRLCEADPLLVTSPELEALMQQVLHRDPEQRPPDMSTLHHALMQLPDDACVRQAPPPDASDPALQSTSSGDPVSSSAPGIVGTGIPAQSLAASMPAGEAEIRPPAPPAWTPGGTEIRPATRTWTPGGTEIRPLSPDELMENAPTIVTPALGTPIRRRPTANPSQIVSTSVTAGGTEIRAPSTAERPQVAATSGTEMRSEATAERSQVASTSATAMRSRATVEPSQVATPAGGAELRTRATAERSQVAAASATPAGGTESGRPSVASSSKLVPALAVLGLLAVVAAVLWSRWPATPAAESPAEPTPVAEAAASPEIAAPPGATPPVVTPPVATPPPVVAPPPVEAESADADEAQDSEARGEKKTSFAEAMKGLRTRVRKCLTAQGVGSRTRVRFEVAIEAKTGRVSGATPQGSTGRAGLGACVVEAARGTVIRPAPANEWRRSYEF